MITTLHEKDTQRLFEKMAKSFVNEVSTLLEEKEAITVALPGGRSVVTFLNLLSGLKLPWEKIHLFTIDERLVDITHEDSNTKLLYESFINKLYDEGKLSTENIHLFETNSDVADYGIAAYEETLKSHGGMFDIAILGVGEDAHVAALAPNHHSIKDDTPYFITMDDSPKPPPKRMSSSRKLLLESTVAYALFIGEGKQEAYELFKKEDDIVSCPVSLIKQLPKAYVVTNLD